MTDDELHEMLAAYALDALDPDEAAIVENEIARRPEMSALVDEYREAIAGTVPPVDPPPGLWDSIASQLGDTSPAPSEVAPSTGVSDLASERTRRRPASVLATLAVAAVAIVVLGIVAIGQQTRIDDLEGDLAAGTPAASVVRSAPGAALLTLETPEGAAVAEIVRLPDGRAFLIGGDLPDLGADRTYQLWSVTGEQVVSAGVLGSSLDVVPFAYAGDADAFVLTREVAGGVVTSEGDVVASAETA